MKRLQLILLTLLPFIAASCYYDKADQLYTQQNCSLDSVTWSKTLAPIVNSKCSIAGCHDAATLACGYDLSQYDALKDVALDGTLLGSLNHASGFSPMPKDAQKLSDCEISKFTQWVNDGTPNN